jgi:hypothetical protein
MKIETKYEIGQEVWALGRKAPFKIHEIDIAITECGITMVYTNQEKDEGYPSIFAEDELYPTKEACEQAIKEMEQ